MDKNTFFQSLLQGFKHVPTPSQEVALEMIASYIFDKKASEKLFLLKGFAGTGQTSITNAIIKTLHLVEHQAVLLAPTGRAAKVMTSFTQRLAYTIHKYIYYHKNSAGEFSFSLRNNKLHNTLFIVDEASMISHNETAFGSASLLTDLIRFVYMGHNCKLLLIGDTAQLPPVHTTESPALNIAHLECLYQKEVIATELTEVVRQHHRSSILRNATHLRKVITNPYNYNNFQFNLKLPDLIRLLDGDAIQEAINDAYDEYGSEETIVIVRSNKSAVVWNQQIRRIILDAEDEIEAGDLLMIVKNDYYWCKDNNQVSFIANGDTIEVLSIQHIDEYYGFRFAKITAQLIDYPNIPPFDTVILLDTLTSETSSLTNEQNRVLYEEVLEEYAYESSVYQRYQKIKEDPYYNALQVKFSYTITCHKSQGGQWDVVFIEKPYLPQNYVIDESYYRWLYTALTRAKKKVYLIGFTDEDFV